MGVVQGLTEFLPISSSGHLVVTEAAIGLTTPGVTVEVALHVATLLAVLVVYRVRIGRLVWGIMASQGDAWRYVGLLAVASLPAAVVGLAFEEWFTRVFDSLLAVGVNFLVTGAVLWSTRHVRERGTAAQPTVVGAGEIGVAQAFAILPGISRSGTTVAAAMWLGLDPVRAAEFSFLMAVPAIAGAAALQLSSLSGNLAAVGNGPLAASFGAALVSGVLAIRLLVALLARGAFHRFAPYCWTIGVITIAWALLQ